MRILTVVDYDEMWPALFENERTLLQMTLGKVISRIHHIGSTSVPGLSAKPVIDILIEVANLEELDSLNQAMEGVGYTVRGENGILNRRYFTKGGNQRSHHIHAFATGDAQIIKHLAFRDYHNRDKDGRLSIRYDPDSHTSFGVPSFIASNYVCDRVLHWYEGNQHAPLNGVMSFFHK
ncbi:GrpB family protein [Klebsiella pneumoniae]|uniref:GrpB family protein n=1 Tax=Klebsiella pneumoniae TaxID=573 RepID=UPI003D663890